MINIIKLGFKPHSCCWVHKKGQAQGLLAVYVPYPYFSYPGYSVVFSADATSGVIRLYDGRGNDQPLETIDSVHRFPVHAMAVCTVTFSLRLCTYIVFHISVQRPI